MLRSEDRLIIIMGIPLLVRQHFNIETPTLVTLLVTINTDQVLGELLKESTTTAIGNDKNHHSDVIMSEMASKTTSVSIVYSLVRSGADQRKHQSSASLAFVGWPVNFQHKVPVTWKTLPFDDVIMVYILCRLCYRQLGIRENCETINPCALRPWWLFSEMSSASRKSKADAYIWEKQIWVSMRKPEFCERIWWHR